MWWCQPQRQIPVVIRGHKKQRRKFWTLNFFVAVQGILKARVCKWDKCCKVAKQKLLFYSAKFLLSGNMGALFTVQQNGVFLSVSNWQKPAIFWYAGSFGSGLDHLLWIRLRSIWITSSLLKSVLTVVEIFPIWGVEEWKLHPFETMFKSSMILGPHTSLAYGKVNSTLQETAAIYSCRPS